MNEEKKEKKEKKRGDSWDSVKGFAIWLGTYGWIFLLIGGILFILMGFIGLAYPAVEESLPPVLYTNLVIDIAGYLHVHGLFTYVLWFIGGILAIILTLAFVKPRFSNKWKEEDYDYLLNDVIKIGNLRIPLMLIVGIILEILMSWWSGLFFLFIPLLLLIFMGPKEYKWKEEEK